MLKNQQFLNIALPKPVRQLFTYLAPQGLDSIVIKKGMRVFVPFRSKTLVGIVVEVTKESPLPINKLKEAIEVIDDQPVFTDDIFQLCVWAADYYQHPIGEVLSYALPAVLRKGAKIGDDEPLVEKTDSIKPEALQLNSYQEKAVHRIHVHLNQFKVFLLDGVTGSGKTEVYARIMETTLKQGKQILILVPEISLTPQTFARFEKRFDCKVALLHSGLTQKKRFENWLCAKSGGANIIIGTRSAVFAPFKKLGLIVIDEEHDPSFKQQDRFRFHARDVAIMRANILNIPIILGSATPSLESLLNVERNRYIYLCLPERVGEHALPQYDIVDLGKRVNEDGLSIKLINEMDKHLNANQQVLLFLNRRGFAPVLYCKACGHIEKCHRCDARMVYHADPCLLHCHHCDKKKPLPPNCAACKAAGLIPIGLGTQRIEEALKIRFKDVPIIRIDKDNTKKKNTMQTLLKQINHEKKAILLGTQMLAKGHHFPNVTLVGVIDADSGFFSADFRAVEQVGQLIVQVAGRAGREKKGNVIIQTLNPSYKLLTTLLFNGYAAFARIIMEERKQYGLPPFTYLVALHAESHDEKNAIQFLNRIKQMSIQKEMIVLGPAPATMTKKCGKYRYYLLIKAQHRKQLKLYLSNVLKKIEKMTTSAKWIIDVDPIEVS